MIPTCKLRGAVLAATLLALAATATVRADWLVLEDGSRVETRGAWTIDGRQIVFHQPDGTYSSLKLDLVDLEASRELTQGKQHKAETSDDATKPAAEPTAPRRKLTNSDIGAGAGPPILDEAAAAADDAAPADETSRTLAIAGWEEQREGFDQVLEIHGGVRNTRRDATAAKVQVEVILFDAEGQMLAKASAEVTPSTLAAGQQGSFVARFPDVFSYGAVSFRTSSIDLVQEPEGPEAVDEQASAP